MTTNFKSMPDILHHCEHMGLLIAKELEASPLYVVRTPMGFGETDVEAFVRPGYTDFAIRRMLISRGDWRGPGTTVAFCRSMPLPDALAVTVHELAHVLPFVQPRREFDPTPQQVEEQTAVAAMQLRASVSDKRPGWETGHDLAFIRRALHLHFRAWRLGFNPCLHRANIAGWQYGTSPGWKYMFALGGEPERMLHASFAEIEATEPPTAFTDLYESDRAYWRTNDGGNP